MTAPLDPPVYLDNAATTPVRPEVLDAMLPYLRDDGFGNPSSAHRWGRTAKQGVETARRQVADALGCEPATVCFTSGGTEADNLAIIGTALAARDAGKPFRVAVSALEHPAIQAAADEVVRLGGEAFTLGVDATGQVHREETEDALAQGVSVLSAMWVNNEVGTVQDVAYLKEACSTSDTIFHTDAVQALGKVPCRADAADMLSISGHKIGAPKGVGAIILRNGDLVHALVHGGNQQSGIRPGTENTSGIVALGAAVELAVRDFDANQQHFRTLQERFESELRAAVPDLQIAGETGHRAPHISNVLIPGIDTDAALMHLDLAGIACSTGSACKTGTVEPSRVLVALGIPPELTRCSLRFSYYKQTTLDDIERAIPVIAAVVARTRHG